MLLNTAGRARTDHRPEHNVRRGSGPDRWLAEASWRLPFRRRALRRCDATLAVNVSSKASSDSMHCFLELRRRARRMGLPPARISGPVAVLAVAATFGAP